MFRERTYFTAALIILHGTATLLAQEKALPCLLSADFEAGLPAGWNIGDPVPVVNGDGSTVDAWRVANASEANANGFFPVPDMPFNGRFIMANDDATPCDCDMAAVSLTSPVVDLSGTTGAVLQYRVFHDGNFNGGAAEVEASSDGSTWTRVDSIPAVERAWQQRFVDLSTFDGVGGVQVRFRWSDNGQWASGVAVDDICIRGRLADDLTMVQAFIHDPEPSPFNTAVRSLRYTELPLQQVEAITVAARVRNSGRNTARQVRMNVSITQNGNTEGPFTSAVMDSLVPGEEALLRVATGWTPSAVGELSISYAVEAQATDEDVLDNTAQESMRITGPGWADGYGALGSGTTCVNGSVVIENMGAVLVRGELRSEDRTSTGITAMLGAGTDEGSTIRGIVVDANLSLIDTTARRTLTADDVSGLQQGGYLFFPFAAGSVLNGDVYYGIQTLGSGARVEVLTGGEAWPGAAVQQAGIFQDVSFLGSTPQLKLHFEEVGVGVSTPDPPSSTFYVGQEGDHLVIDRSGELSPGTLVVFDATGRLLMKHGIGQGIDRISLPREGFGAGMLTVVLKTKERAHAQRIVIPEGW
jgi:hypothetical protein